MQQQKTTEMNEEAEIFKKMFPNDAHEVEALCLLHREGQATRQAVMQNGQGPSAQSGNEPGENAEGESMACDEDQAKERTEEGEEAYKFSVDKGLEAWLTQGGAELSVEEPRVQNGAHMTVDRQCCVSYYSQAQQRFIGHCNVQVSVVPRSKRPACVTLDQSWVVLIDPCLNPTSSS